MNIDGLGIRNKSCKEVGEELDLEYLRKCSQHDLENHGVKEYGEVLGMRKVLVTYQIEVAAEIESVYLKLGNDYAFVHVFRDYLVEEFQKCYERHMLNKRIVTMIVMKPFSPVMPSQQSSNSTTQETVALKTDSNKIIKMQFEDWFHYGLTQSSKYSQASMIQTLLPQFSHQNGCFFKKLPNLHYISTHENNDCLMDQAKIYSLAVKNLQLEFVWIGASCRLGASLSEFASTVCEQENFVTYRTEFMIIFFKILNKKMKGVSDRFDSSSEDLVNRLQSILEQCRAEAEAPQHLSLIEQKIQNLVCLRFNVRTIITGITDHRYLKLLQTRNYFKLIWIQQPALTRFAEFQRVIHDNGLHHLSQWLDFIKFSILDDYWYERFVQRISKIAHFNISAGRGQNWAQLIESNYTQIIRPFRPSFDQYFLSICEILKTRGGCIKEAVGAVIVKNKRILATGYNGTPIGSVNCFQGGCTVCDNSLEMNTIVLSCNCIHAESSCIIEAGISVTPDSTLYTTRLPCLWCSKVIVQARIATVVYLSTEYPSLEYPNIQKVHKIYKEAGIVLRESKRY